MKYTIEQLADIIDGDRGNNYPKQDEFFDKGFCIFLNTGNVTTEGFRFDEVQYITQEKDSLLRKGKLQRGDIIYTTRGTVGNAAYYTDTVPYEHIRINSGMVILRCKDVVNPCFLYHILKSDYYRPYFKQYCTGSAQPQLPIKNFSRIQLDIPNYEVQEHVASILSAYDNLIENNQKQIKLLEEAAQRLYKEWFVDLRFPGYENTPMVDGVPDGWKKVCLKDICLLRKIALTPNEIPPGMPYIGLEHMPRKDICLCKWGESSEVNSNKFQYKERDILFGKIRPYFHKVGFAINDGIASTDCIIMYPKGQLWGLLLMTVSSDAFVNYTAQSCKEGSKMPRADWNEMKKYPVLVADTIVQAKFEELIENITNRIKLLAIQNRRLTEARDRLLPKLISGEVAQ